MGSRIAAMLIFLGIVCTPARAEGAIAFGGGAGAAVYAADGQTAIDHLFGSSPAITPGERLEDGLCVLPQEDTALFLRCPEVPEALWGLRLTVSRGETGLYDGSLEEAGLIPLGEFSAGSRTMLEIHLQIPENLPEEGHSAWGQISWQILAISGETPQTADTAHPTAAAATGTLTGLALAALQKRREKKIRETEK